jgi:Effector-associated domain 1
MAQALEKRLPELHQALLSAFPSYDELSAWAEFSQLVDSFEADIAPPGGALKPMVLKLLRHLKAAGDLEKALRQAIEDRPRNPELLKLGREHGCLPVAGAKDFLCKSSFDLREHETRLEEQIRGSDQPGMQIFLLVDANEDMLESLVVRLKRLMTEGPVEPADHTVTLNPRVTNADREVGLLGGRRATLDDRHLLVRVRAESASADMVHQFLQGARVRFAPPLPRHLVLLITTPDLDPCPAGALALARPALRPEYLNIWASNVTQGQGWPDDLVPTFKTWLRSNSELDGALSWEAVYTALSEAIRFLSTNPDPATLRQFLAKPLW